MPRAENPAAFLNEQLMSGLRPTLFLAQLSNLLAGNISIVHGVTGSSRTFMGEESAGVDAVRIALSRIASGQSDIALVGGAHNGERPDLFMLYEFGSLNLKEHYTPVWERGKTGRLRARLARRLPGDRGPRLCRGARRQAAGQAHRPCCPTAPSARPAASPPASPACGTRSRTRSRPATPRCLSGATGAEPATSEERAFLAAHGDLAVRATGSYLGHGLEPQFPMNIALAVVTLGHGSLFPPCDSTGLERPMSGELSQVLVTGVGHWRGEGLALVERVG